MFNRYKNAFYFAAAVAWFGLYLSSADAQQIDFLSVGAKQMSSVELTAGGAYLSAPDTGNPLTSGIHRQAALGGQLNEGAWGSFYVGGGSDSVSEGFLRGLTNDSTFTVPSLTVGYLNGASFGAWHVAAGFLYSHDYADHGTAVAPNEAGTTLAAYTLNQDRYAVVSEVAVKVGPAVALFVDGQYSVNQFSFTQDLYNAAGTLQSTGTIHGTDHVVTGAAGVQVDVHPVAVKIGYEHSQSVTANSAELSGVFATFSYKL